MSVDLLAKNLNGRFEAISSDITGVKTAHDLLAKNLNGRFEAISFDITGVKTAQTDLKTELEAFKTQISTDVNEKIETAFKNLLSALEGIEVPVTPGVTLPTVPNFV